MGVVTEGKNEECKPSLNTGKVSAKPTEGASWSRKLKTEINVSRNKRMEISMNRHVRMTAKGESCFMIRAAEPCDFTLFFDISYPCYNDTSDYGTDFLFF